MNKYFYLQDLRDFFQDEKIAKFIWGRANRHLLSSKPFRRNRLYPERHKNVVYLEKHFKKYVQPPTTNKRNRLVAETYLAVIMPQMAEFKKYVSSLDI